MLLGTPIEQNGNNNMVTMRKGTRSRKEHSRWGKTIVTFDNLADFYKFGMPFWRGRDFEGGSYFSLSIHTQHQMEKMRDGPKPLLLNRIEQMRNKYRNRRY